jgi:hypothetical protein
MDEQLEFVKMSDASKHVEKRYKEMLLSLTPLERLKMASRIYDSGRKLVITGIQHGKHPLTASQLRGQVFLRMYGRDFTVEEKARIVRRIPNME